MSCCGPVIIGATCDDQINYGETIDLTLTYRNEDGSPIDLSSATPSIFSSSPQSIKDRAVISITDAEGGLVRLFLSREYALNLRRGANNRFRVQMIFGSESDDVTPDIYLQVT